MPCLNELPVNLGPNFKSFLVGIENILRSVKNNIPAAVKEIRRALTLLQLVPSLDGTNKDDVEQMLNDALMLLGETDQ